MLYLVDTKGVYGPEVVTIMATAFDRVCHFRNGSAATTKFANCELTRARCVPSTVPKYPWMTA
jgi:hypothetical protein